MHLKFRPPNDWIIGLLLREPSPSKMVIRSSIRNEDLWANAIVIVAYFPKFWGKLYSLSCTPIVALSSSLILTSSNFFLDTCYPEYFNFPASLAARYDYGPKFRHGIQPEIKRQFPNIFYESANACLLPFSFVSSPGMLMWWQKPD